MSVFTLVAKTHGGGGRRGGLGGGRGGGRGGRHGRGRGGKHGGNRGGGGSSAAGPSTAGQ